jgi:hypothetical protein
VKSEKQRSNSGSDEQVDEGRCEVFENGGESHGGEVEYAGQRSVVEEGEKEEDEDGRQEQRVQVGRWEAVATASSKGTAGFRLVTSTSKYGSAWRSV